MEDTVAHEAAKEPLPGQRGGLNPNDVIIDAHTSPRPVSILTPFPAWELPRINEARGEGKARLSRTTHALGRAPPVSSPLNSAAPSTQTPQRSMRFNLRDGVKESIKAMRERVEAKEMVVSEALYGFYSSEICLHFLHALAAYFIRVAKDYIVAASGVERQQGSRNRRSGTLMPPASPPRSEQGNGHGADPASEDEATFERASLLREVGRSYARVVIYCSNFERTSADALFFESLLHLARRVVATTVSEPSLELELDTEFDRILRGEVFGRAILRPPPQPAPTRCRTMGCSTRRYKPGHDNQTFRTDDRRQASFWIEGFRAGLKNSVTPASTSSTQVGTSRSIKRPAPRGGRALVPTKRPSARAPGRRTATPGRSDDGNGNSNVVRICRKDKFTNGRPSRGLSPARCFDSNDVLPSSLFSPPVGPAVRAGGNQHPLAAKHSRGEEMEGRDASTNGVGLNWVREKTDEDGRREPSEVLLPRFDELSRWRFSRGTIPKMVRMVFEVERVALSNLKQAESYRKSLAAKFHREKAAPNRGFVEGMSGAEDGRSETPSKPQEIFNHHGTGAIAKQCSTDSSTRRASSWRRRGRVLTFGQRSHGRGACDDIGGRHVFNAETISVCIASIVERDFT